MNLIHWQGKATGENNMMAKSDVICILPNKREQKKKSSKLPFGSLLSMNPVRGKACIQK